MSSLYTCIRQLSRWFCLAGGLLLALGAHGQAIEKALMPGEVIQGHAKYEQQCEQCHRRFDKKAQDRLCLDCHKEVAGDIKNRRRLHGKLNETTCHDCHTDHKGRGANIAVVDKKKFDHGQTDFDLRGAHREARCDSCHRAGTRYRETPHACVDCHKKDDQKKGHQGHLGNKCESCHREKNWTETRFDHEKTKFPLRGGKHQEVKCKSCHEDKTYRNTPLTCNGCHEKVDQEKGHRGRYGTKCESCHDDRSWKESIFEHDQDTDYPLRGKHRQAKCNTCHLPEKGPIYKVKLPTRCYSCHKADDQQKGHRGELGEKCENCHSERGWKTTAFDHETSKFPLRDKHKDAKCESCHKLSAGTGPRQYKVDTACISCHRKNDEGKGHRGRYGEKCGSCHSARDWKSSRYDHDRETRYPLKGKHRETRCDNCHLPEKGNIFSSKLESQCIACHRKDDKHKGQLGSKCESCHDEKKWKDTPYDHRLSRFPLTGSHVRVECRKCHETPAFKDAPTACSACHDKDDKHKGGFGRKCETCHYTGTWKSWDFDHGTTRFPLTGGHRRVDCRDCHKGGGGRPEKPARACVACHVADDVHHGGFGAQCEHCHVDSNWRRVKH